jgi:transposase
LKKSGDASKRADNVSGNYAGTSRVQEVIPVKRKNPYSQINVNEISIQQLLKDRAGQKAAVGVDVSKAELTLCLVWRDKDFERPWRVKSPGQIPLAVSMLLELNRQCPVTVAMESSGTYGDAFRQALDDAGLPVHRVSGKAVKDDSEGFDGVPSSHDGKDAAIIGTLCMNGRSKLWPWHGAKVESTENESAKNDSAKNDSAKNDSAKNDSADAESAETDQAIRYWVRQLDTAQRIKQMWCGKLEAMLARHWPEAGRLTNQSGPTLTGALLYWGDPRAMTSDPSAAKKLAKIGGHYLKREKIDRLIESARSTVGVRMNAWSIREMRDIAGAITEQRKKIQQCRRELKKLTKDHKPIQSQAKAVGLTTACVLWMCLGDPQQYGSAGAYRKAMGLNLAERSSGTYKGKLKLSKRGQRLPRKWLYFSSLRWMREPSVKIWLENKKRRDGGRGGKAATGITRRLAAAAWHAGQGEVFDPKRLFPGAGRVVAGSQ